MNYYPDYWQVVKITSSKAKPIYKVFATWAGSYVGGEEWRLNSGISSVKIDETRITFEGASGSSYICIFKENCYRTSSWSHKVLENLTAQVKERYNSTITVLPFNTDWSKINDCSI